MSTTPSLGLHRQNALEIQNLQGIHKNNGILNLALIEPGKPRQNGLNESFNGKLRDERLSMEWFRCRTEARVVIEELRRHYNAVRPHSSQNNLSYFSVSCQSVNLP